MNADTLNSCEVECPATPEGVAGADIVLQICVYLRFQFPYTILNYISGKIPKIDFNRLFSIKPEEFQKSHLHD